MLTIAFSYAVAVAIGVTLTLAFWSRSVGFGTWWSFLVHTTVLAASLTILLIDIH